MGCNGRDLLRLMIRMMMMIIMTAMRKGSRLVELTEEDRDWCW
jgi:hypothetical protein